MLVTAITANMWFCNEITARTNTVDFETKRRAVPPLGQHQVKSMSTAEDKTDLVQWSHQAHPLWGAAQVKFQGAELHPCQEIQDNTCPASFPPHISCNNFHMEHGPQALTAEPGEGKRVTNLLFFFLYFHYHQISDECYFCKTQHKKNSQ